MAASMGDAPDYLPGQLQGWKDALKALRHTQDALNNLVGALLIRFFLSLFLQGDF